jgi:hypothetical protein
MPSVTRDQLILWLMDRNGKSVQADMSVIIGDVEGPSLSVVGDLKPWREHPAADVWEGKPREDVAGVFYIGEAGIDVTELPPEFEARLSNDELVVDLIETEDDLTTRLRVVEIRNLDDA